MAVAVPFSLPCKNTLFIAHIFSEVWCVRYEMWHACEITQVSSSWLPPQKEHSIFILFNLYIEFVHCNNNNF